MKLQNKDCCRKLPLEVGWKELFYSKINIMIEFKENKWAHRAKREELEKKFNKNWEDIHTTIVHNEHWVYLNVSDENSADRSIEEFENYLESSNIDFSRVWAVPEDICKENQEIQIKVYGAADNHKINQYPSIGDLNYFADHRLLIIKVDNRYCIFHTKTRPSNLLLEHIIECVEMPQDIDLPLGDGLDSHLYVCESNMKPEFIEQTHYVYFTNQELSQNFNDEALILTDNIKQECYLFDQITERYEEYRSFKNIDDALETMYQLLHNAK
tara:strand:+ start:67 stop:876 length:810 start_codon:yes stop_codon:yes gene_type:complete